MTRHATNYSEKEMMAVFFARDMKDGELVCAGANTEVCFTACLLAQKMHAPNLILTLGANCFYCNVSDRDCTLYPSSADYRNIRWAESRYQHPDIFLYLPRADHWFVGGNEVDKYGNTNMMGIGYNPVSRRWKFRGPGGVGIIDVSALVKDNYIFVMRHDRRTLVDRVQFISAAGFLDGPGSRERLGLLGNGPKYLATPKAVFDFHPETKRARLFQLMPGVTLDWVVDNTGFEIVMPEGKVEEVEPPTLEEITILRSIDKLGLCRK